MDDVKSLIKSLVGVEDVDDSLLDFIYNAEKQHILNFCNRSDLPEELEKELIQMAAGRYILIKKGEILGDNAEIVTSVSEGDVSVSFNADTPSERLDSLIAYLTRERDLVCYRKLKW